MGVTGTIFWKETRSFFHTPAAYFALVCFLVFTGANYFMGSLTGGGFTGLQEKQASLELFFAGLPWAFVIIVPALAMKLWPDELKLGTIELLMSYPVKPRQVVVGKFLAGWMLVVVALAATLVTPVTVAKYGRLDWGPVWGSYAAAVLMGAAFLSVGLFAGALCREQVAAFILSGVICGGLVGVGKADFLLQASPTVASLIRQVSFTTRFESMARGVIEVRDVIYYATFTALFLTLNIVVIEARKTR